MAVSEDSEVKQENAHIKEVEEFVFDQDMIVTYKKLSKLLHIHVNKAKRVLSLMVERNQRSKRPLSVTYLVSGREAGSKDGAWRVCVVPEGQLEETRAHFESEGRSEHVYSVHQGAEVKDLAAIIIASKSDDGSCSCAAIENKEARPRSEELMQQLTKQVAPQPTTSKPTLAVSKKPVAQPAKKESPKETPKADVAVKDEEKKAEAEVHKEGEAKQGNTIAGMFAAQNGKPTEGNKTSNAKPAGKGGKKGPVSAGASIASFFQRQREAPPKPKPATTENVEDDGDKKNTTTKEDSPSSNQAKEAVVNSKASKPSKRPVAANKRKGKQDDASKKRKRILTLDSDSSDEDEAVCVEEMQVDSPPPPVAVLEEEQQQPQPEPQSVGVVKERKLVDKVFKDEKGFIVTKKEWVTEVRQVEVEPVEVKPPAPKEEKPAPAPAKRKQQSDIMSFFGRK